MGSNRFRGLLDALTSRMPAFGQFVQRHSQLLRRLGVIQVSLVSIVLGGLLAVAPLGELASGEDLHFTSLVSVLWLAMALTMLAAGFATLLRMVAFRKLYRISLYSSLPVVGFFLYQSVATWIAKGRATGAVKEELAIVSSGLFLVSFAFAAVSGFLLFVNRWHVLAQHQCSSRVMSSKAGPVIVAISGGAAGGGIAMLLWFLFRWLGVIVGVEVFQDVIAMIRFELFFAIGAIPAAVFAVRRHTKRSPSAPRPVQSAPSPVQSAPSPQSHPQVPSQSPGATVLP